MLEHRPDRTLVFVSTLYWEKGLVILGTFWEKGFVKHSFVNALSCWRKIPGQLFFVSKIKSLKNFFRQFQIVKTLSIQLSWKWSVTTEILIMIERLKEF